jgi:exportin-2 (importin alpha re-exporter)
MKATARVISIAKEDTLPFVEKSLSILNQKLVTIYKAPSNPDFGYYLFETLANVISLSVKCDPAAVDRIEQLLFPVFQKILVEPGGDVFSPFVFQLMSILLETRNGKLPDAYKPLLKELTTPLFWEQQGNVPALTRLLQAYISSGPDFVVSSKLLLNILGVFQKLVSSKINDYLGFYLLQSIVEHVPLNDFSFALPDVFKIIFIRVQGSKTGQLVKGFIVFLSVFIGKYGPKIVVDAMSSLQQGIFAMVLQSLWIPNVEAVKGKIERKTCSIAMTKLLCEWPEMLGSPFVDLWPKLLQQTVHLFEGLEGETVVTKEDLFNEDSERGGHYTSGFTDLHHAARTEVDPFKDVNPKVFLAQSLNKLMQADPVKVTPLVSSVGEQYTHALMTYFQSAGIS